jgi:hypothetical protein
VKEILSGFAYAAIEVGMSLATAEVLRQGAPSPEEMGIGRPAP